MKQKKILLTLLVLALGAGEVAAEWGLGDNWEAGASWEGIIIPNTRNPSDGTDKASPITLKMNVTCTGTYASNGYDLWNSTGDLLEDDNVVCIGTCTCGQEYSFVSGSSLILDVGEYTWRAKAQEAVGPTEPYRYSTNTTFTIISGQPIQSETGGACLSEQGLFMNYTFTGTDNYIAFDLTGLNGYIDSGNLSNVHAEYTTESIYDTTMSGQLLVNNLDSDTIRLWIGSWTYDYNHTTDATHTPDQTITLTEDNFTQYNPSYLIHLKDETTSATWDYNNLGSMTLDVYCDTFSPDTIDVQNDLVNTSFYIAAKERPDLIARVNGDALIRYWDAVEETENITLYLYNTTNTTDAKVSYTLEDFTGDFEQSYLQTITNINGSLEIVNQKQWYNLGIDAVSLINNTDYQYRLYTPDRTKIIAWDRITGDKIQPIIVRDPLYTEYNKWADGVEIGFTSSYTASTIGITYNITVGDVNTLDFKVYNYTSGLGYQLEYETTVTDNLGTVDYIVEDQNDTYWVTVEADTTTYGDVDLARYICPAETEERYPLYDSFGLPDTIAGIDKDHIYTGASIFLITLVACIVGPISSLGSLLFIGTVGVVKWFGWFREMTWPVWSFLMAMAVAYSLTARRRKQE